MLNLMAVKFIPAKAGIFEKTWIPAFAGMTAGQDNRPIYVRLHNINYIIQKIFFVNKHFFVAFFSVFWYPSLFRENGYADFISSD